jgi:hypothetical protein
MKKGWLSATWNRRPGKVKSKVPFYSLMTYRRIIEVYLHSLLASALDGGELSTLHSATLCAGKETCYQMNKMLAWIPSWSGHGRVGKKISCTCQKLNHVSSGFWPSHYINCTILDPIGCLLLCSK